MKILMVNKFLYPNGGSETYIFKLGEQLIKEGHEVEYFGMEHDRRIVGNKAESYTSNMDFHTGKLQKLLYPFKIIYSREARRKIRAVLEDFMPDVVHLNNFNYQLTPSIIYEIKDFDKKYKRKTAVIYTAHDYQWVCPNHMFRIPATGELCMRCAGGAFENCMKYNCIHNSKVRSMIGAIEGKLYHILRTYRYVDRIICPSEFMNRSLSNNPLLKEKTITLHNFIEEREKIETEVIKKDYVLYFGRYAEEKGIGILLEVCAELADIPFVFAGGGPLESKVNTVSNIENKGFLSGEELKRVIREARFVVFPSQWYENCPFSVMEAQMYLTPVLGSDLGGTPELIREQVSGELFAGGDKEELKEKIEKLWNNRELCGKYISGCRDILFDSTEDYCQKLIEIYKHTLS